MGPAVNENAVLDMLDGVNDAVEQGGECSRGAIVSTARGSSSSDADARRASMPVVQREIFARDPYVMEYDDLEQAIAWHNDVPQGLSSAIFTSDFYQAETFLSVRGSDCGIANVNIGTSGAETGGAFGGEKETGAAARPAATPGKPTCGARPSPSTGRTNCRWPKGCSSICRVCCLLNEKKALPARLTCRSQSCALRPSFSLL